MRLCSLTALASTLLSILLISSAQAQQQFPSADEAAKTLVSAARANDDKAMLAILGPGAASIVSSGDPVEDANARKTFVDAYDAKHRIDGKTLLVGPDDFPFPIPLRQKDGRWSFDGVAGREEILARRIGLNELDTILVALAYFDAQNEYADMASKTTGASAYAQRLVSSPGKKDGLYWPTTGDEATSPIGEAVATATAQGYRVGRGEPYHGYLYKILKRQGPAALGGELNYVVDGKMIGGFGLVAWPAQYGNSGIATFMINSDGMIYEKDLGPNTAKIAAGLTSFNPSAGWRKTDVSKAEAEVGNAK